jgi:hypothetical protein
MNATYTGIGARDTSDSVLEKMKEIAVFFGSIGYVLRSGGADGADSAFEEGCDSVKGKKEIYLPWEGFNGSSSHLYGPTTRAMEIASEYHPAWSRCKQGVRKMHARNSHQVLGQLCLPEDKSDFIVCFHRNTGGTMQAVRVAGGYNVVVFNLFYDEHLVCLRKLANKIKKGLSNAK